MKESRLACIVLLRPNIENDKLEEASMHAISVSLIADPINTAVFVPCKSDGLRPASIIDSIDLSKSVFVNKSITLQSFG